MWIIKQERGYRYIAGEKVSTDNLEEWDNLTRYYQKRAEQLYGDKPEDYGRIHLHGIVWCPKKRIDQWGYGYTHIGDYVNQTTIAYVTKYMLKICEKWPDFRGKVMCSAGIGCNYETSYNAKRNVYRGKETKETIS